ncbi:hypothetical protein CBR_g36368 [Chara braunii]|uniref:Uncharacterized protein n=1 Tax=Chara braunii TaxID=69332 RepID=A0A388LKI8_CHABU|nr:hypothetical protein CBR_g36368 [Chara braunii]|eukprot:GBG82838.1 hypothetical protein CBR_g36368 [Chara braunii]
MLGCLHQLLTKMHDVGPEVERHVHSRFNLHAEEDKLTTAETVVQMLEISGRVQQIIDRGRMALDQFIAELLAKISDEAAKEEDKGEGTDYAALLCKDHGENLRTLQYLGFYQQECMGYTATKLGLPFSQFDIDKDLDPLFKEAWCKKHPPQLLVPGYAMQPPIPRVVSTVPQLEETPERMKLIQNAIQIGQLIQNQCPGFLHNARQHHMAGFAAIEIAQTVSRVWNEMKMKEMKMECAARQSGPEEATVSTNGPVLLPSARSMAGSQAPGTDSNNASRVDAEVSNDGQGAMDATEIQNDIGTESRNSGGGIMHDGKTQERLAAVAGQELNGTAAKKTFGWRDLYNIPVKWRQVSEPCDTVVWVDLLSKEEFEAGFGSHTPMVQGQSRIVRYYPNFARAFALMKQTMLEAGEVYNGANNPVSVSDTVLHERIIAAKDCKDLYPIVGEDFWVVTPCEGLHTGKVLEGTRLTLQKSMMPSIRNGYNFSIRTPGTPPRWADYDAELEAVWKELCDAVCSRNAEEISKEEKTRIQDCILTLSFYWYNFMPLARGTAAVGYITLLGLLMACGLQPTARIPKGVQVDWEAILTRHPEQFISSIRTWLYPSITVVNGAKCGACDSLPVISEALPTLADVIGALNRSVKL